MKWLAAACLTLVVASPANAEWQGTTWGMSPAEAASLDEPIRYFRISSLDTQIKTKGPYRPLVGAIWKDGDHSYRAFLYFDRQDRLSFIGLEDEGLRCGDYPTELIERWGEGTVAIEEVQSQGRTVTTHSQTWPVNEKAEIFAEQISAEGFGVWSCSLLVRAPGWKPDPR